MTAKGMALERYLDRLHKLYAAQGRALLFKVPTPRSYAGQKRPAVWVDYSGVIAGGMAVAIEAKMCTVGKEHVHSFPLGNFTDGQRATLTDAHAMGAISAVFVRAVGDRVGDYLVPTSFIDGLERRSFRWDAVSHYEVPPGRSWLDATSILRVYREAPTERGTNRRVGRAWASYCETGWGT